MFRRVTRGARFVRINPYHSGTRTEVEALIAEGTQVLMLPYFRDLGEVEEFSEIVAGRTVTVGLVETLPCLDFVGDIIRRGLLTELHVGLTDLSIEMGTHPIEVLNDERFLRAIALIRSSGMAFGIAGFARPDDATLPYHPGEFAMRVAQLGASRAIIARSFLRQECHAHLAEDISKLRSFLAANA